MGIETSPPDVEESTEPPICPFTDKHTSVSSNHTCEVKTGLGVEKLEYPATLEVSTPLPYKSANPALSNDDESSAHCAHTLPPKQLASLLRVDVQNGLSSTEAATRLERDGPNRVQEIEGVSTWKILLRQVSNSLTMVLLITMGISFGIHDYIEGGVITAVIILNIVVGFVQDYRAEKTIMSLHRLSAPVCKVLRDGRVASVPAESVVVGDVVQLRVGDIVPADLRLIDGTNVSMDEALLTGESLPVNKAPQIVHTSRNMPIGDRINMAYSGCSMTQGRATGIVTATGMKTEVGRIAELLQETSDDADSSRLVRAVRSVKSTAENVLGLVGTPLQVKLSKFALLLFALAVLLAIIVFSANKWHIEGEVLIYGIAIGVAVIPESLIAVLTITMAVGTKAMAGGNVIVRKLQCLEAVGGVTNICSDKTGTLTQGRMIARTAWIPGAGTLTVKDSTDPYDPTSGLVQLNGSDWVPEKHGDNPALSTFLFTISLCNMSIVQNEESSGPSGSRWTAVGEPTEVALNVLALRVGHEKSAILQRDGMQLHTEYAFDSIIKRMTTVYKNSRENVNEVYTKGAPEAVLLGLAISEKEKENIQAEADRMAGEGLRVLCIAHKRTPLEDQSQVFPRAMAEVNLEFCGLVGLYDPPRVETAAAVRKCQMAGITVHMLTGDHIKTATAIASEVGILGPMMNARSSRLVMAAAEFDELSDADVDAIEQLPLVIARCSPATKVRMVEAMHRRGAFCVMTGDGVNDSPALKRADVGIAMGKNGSDVAKEAADMVLTDDNFSSIVKAVEEGRRLFDNIQKFLMHLLISNIAQVILLLTALAFKDKHGNSIFPVSPLEILWANLVTSSFLALGLGLEEGQPDLMYRPPHDLKVGVFTKELITDKMIYGTFMGSLCLTAFVCVIYGAGAGISDLGKDCNNGWNETCNVVFRARATTYACLTFLLLITAWEVKHFSRSLFNLDPDKYPGKLSVFQSIWRNRFLFWAVIAGFVVAFPVITMDAEMRAGLTPSTLLSMSANASVEIK